MSDPKNCLTCRYEPEWSVSTPTAKTRAGLCHCPAFKGDAGDDDPRPVLIRVREGIIYFGFEPIAACPAWAAKLA